MDELLQEKRRDLAEDQRLQREQVEWERKLKRDDEEYDREKRRQQSADEQGRKIVEEGIDVLKTILPAIIGKITGSTMPGVAVIAEAIAGLSDQQIQALIHSGILDQNTLIAVIELRDQIRAKRQGSKKAAEATEAVKAEKEKAEADQKLADEMKAAQDAAEKRSQNGKGTTPPDTG